MVGEGPSTRKGLLRFVLDGEGYDVVAEAATTAELARVMAVHRPDVVVLDDGIGAVAVGMINEMSPATDVILVWPGAVMPVGGAARVEPSRVLQDLGPAVESLTGQPCASTSGSGAALLDRAANDPDVLRAMLLGGAAAAAAAADEPIIEDREPAPVVILPVTPTVERDGILQVPEAGSEDDEPTRAPGAAIAGGIAAAATPVGPPPPPKPVARAPLPRGPQRGGQRRRPERPQSQAGEPRPGRRRRGQRARDRPRPRRREDPGRWHPGLRSDHELAIARSACTSRRRRRREPGRGSRRREPGRPDRRTRW